MEIMNYLQYTHFYFISIKSYKQNILLNKLVHPLASCNSIDKKNHKMIILI